MKIAAAAKYFSYIGKMYPVMCASGTFHMMPPVKDAAKWLDRYDDFTTRGIAKHVTKLKKFQQDFEHAESKAANLLDRATARALSLSASCAIMELDIIRTWEKSPALYLQLAFTGLEHAASMPSKNSRAREKRFLKRLKAVPSMLKLAAENVESVSTAERALAQTMIRDCARYLSDLGNSDLGRVGKAPRFLADCLTGLRDFDKFVSARPETNNEEGPSFQLMAQSVLGTDKSASDIYAIAEAEYYGRLEALRSLEPEVGKGWQEALEAYTGSTDENIEARDLVIREIHRLRGFIFETALPSVFHDSGMRIDQQPLHLASTLRPIHYDPALSASEEEPSRCYVSPQIFSGRGFRDDPERLKRMRREYLFMAARQAYPGRHLMDTQRRALGDSPLAQINSPLFVAGWLAFAEDLLEELGYLTSPLDKLVHHQRGLARAGLAMIDAGLAVDNIDQDKCLAIMEGAGFSREESLSRIRSTRLVPASRIMPVLGLYELKRLRESSGMEIDDFCRAIFRHGQIPFAAMGELLHKEN
jgi:hypothetical protein